MTTASEVKAIFDEFVSKYGKQDTYEKDVCESLKGRLESVASKDHGLKRYQLQDIGKSNYLTLEKWSKHFPAALVNCAGEYWKSIAFWAPRKDPRFPNMNQTKNCEINYLDYHRCKDQLGEDAAECDYFKHVYTHTCPTSWVESFDEQFENGVLRGFHKDEYI
ncbi:hypothetical protein GJ496_003853 [Pomphorhynchus laevis]|nr:hypothetical protein GJ496_003853 [Pomphorhynchus laevis]